MKKYENEAVLVKDLKNYKEEAFNYFVKKYQNLVLSYVYSIIQNQDEAWNISQEVFISIFRNIKNFQESSSIKTWMLRIARNDTINRIRYLKVRKQNSHQSIEQKKEDNGNYDLPSNESPLFKLSKKDDQKRLNEALQILDEEERELIVLHFINEIPYEEISQITSMQIGTIKSKIHRSKKRLKDRFIELGGIFDDSEEDL
ncbi:sigma-70 family RNA polymerase sigma factor [bacterium]|nr:sigma-70 family RNA polymerase sigma factor [bacterium]